MHGQQRAAGATRGPELRIELGKTSEITRAEPGSASEADGRGGSQAGRSVSGEVKVVRGDRRTMMSWKRGGGGEVRLESAV